MSLCIKDEVTEDNCGENGSFIVNPMENPLILSYIFDLISKTEDLKEIRNVNRFWRDISLEFWRRRGVVVISAVKEDCTERNSLTIEELMNLCEDEEADNDKKERNRFSGSYLCEYRPFERYRLYNMSPFPKVSGVAQYEKDFYESFGPHMKFLELNECLFYEGSCFVQGLERILLKYCGNLEELVLKQSSYMRAFGSPPAQRNKDENRDNWLTVADKLSSLTIMDLVGFGRKQYGKNLELCREFLKICPKLKNLNLQLNAHANTSIFLEALTYPVMITPTRGFIKLERLSITSRVDNEILNVLKNYIVTASPKIRKLSLRVDLFQLNIEPENLKIIVENLENTLNYLELIIDCERGNLSQLSLAGNEFKNLKELRLCLGGFDSDCLPFDFTCLGGMPQLEKLHCRFPVKCDSFRVRGSQFVRNKGGINGNGIILDNLREFYFDRSLTVDSLELLGRWMPKVKEIQVVLNEETMPVVFKAFAQIEKVTILEMSQVGEESIKRENSKNVQVVINDTML